MSDAKIMLAIIIVVYGGIYLKMRTLPDYQYHFQSTSEMFGGN